MLSWVSHIWCPTPRAPKLRRRVTLQCVTIRYGDASPTTSRIPGVDRWAYTCQVGRGKALLAIYWLPGTWAAINPPQKMCRVPGRVSTLWRFATVQIRCVPEEPVHGWQILSPRPLANFGSAAASILPRPVADLPDCGQSAYYVLIRLGPWCQCRAVQSLLSTFYLSETGHKNHWRPINFGLWTESFEACTEDMCRCSYHSASHAWEGLRDKLTMWHDPQGRHPTCLMDIYMIIDISKHGRIQGRGSRGSGPPFFACRPKNKMDPPPFSKILDLPRLNLNI